MHDSCCCCGVGAAHNSGRSASGVPNALHQQHLTPAQQATQAAITAPATHQDGKVPVRTGLAWAALGQSLLACLPALPFGRVCSMSCLAGVYFVVFGIVMSTVRSTGAA